LLRGRFGLRFAASAETRNRLQEPASVSNRDDPDLFQIFSCQFGQNVEADFILLNWLSMTLRSG
jgi:hypothetical protein